jgi:hypothetical protein
MNPKVQMTLAALKRTFEDADKEVPGFVQQFVAEIVRESSAQQQ